jgi:hypothetical protein
MRGGPAIAPTTADTRRTSVGGTSAYLLPADVGFRVSDGRGCPTGGPARRLRPFVRLGRRLILRRESVASTLIAGVPSGRGDLAAPAASPRPHAHRLLPDFEPTTAAPAQAAADDVVLGTLPKPRAGWPLPCARCGDSPPRAACATRARPRSASGRRPRSPTRTVGGRL